MSSTQLPLLQNAQHDFMHSRRQSVLSNYDPLAFPPNLDFARKHGASQSIGQYIPPKQDIERCPCCLAPIYKPQLPLSCQLRQFIHIGEAYPLYFHFVKQCIVLLLINILISSIPSLLINLSQGNMCVQLDGLVYNFYSMICKSSVINIMNVTEIDMLQIQSILNFIAIIISIIIIGLLDIFMEDKYAEFKMRHQILPKASEYSIQVRGLPKDIRLSEIVKFVQQKLVYAGAIDTKVLKVYVIYSMREYYRLYANKSSVIQKIVILNTKKQKTQKQIQELGPTYAFSSQKQKSTSQKLINKKKSIIQEINQLENKGEVIQIQINNYQQLFKIVIEKFKGQSYQFNEELSAEIKINQQQKDITRDFNFNQRVQILQSEEEQETHQKNINEPELKKQQQPLQIHEYESIDVSKNGLKLKFSGKCIITLNNTQSRDVLVGQTENMYFLQRLGNQVSQFLGGSSGSIVITNAPEPSDIIFQNLGSEKIQQWRDWLWVTISLTLLILLDFFLLTLSKKFVKQQKAINKQNLLFSLLNSQLIALFNSIVSRVIRSSQNKTQMHSTHSSYYYSVTSKLVILFLINMLVTTFFSNLVNYYLINEKSQTFQKFPLNFQEYLFDLFFLIITNPFISIFLIFFDHRQGYKLYRRYMIQNSHESVTQAQANANYQNMGIDLSNKYGNTYRFVLFSAGACFIYPPSLIICMVSISVFYWLDKYLLLRRYVVSHKVGFKLTMDMQKIFWLFPLLQAATNLVIMFVPIRDGSAFKEGKYSKGFYYLALVGMIIAGIVYLGGCNWVIKGLKWALGKEKAKGKGGKGYEMYVDSMKYPAYKQIQMDFEEDYWHHYPYFRINKKKYNDSPNKSQMSSSEIDSQSMSPTTRKKSPRKSKIAQLQNKVGMDVFAVIKSHLHHDKYSPIV